MLAGLGALKRIGVPPTIKIVLGDAAFGVGRDVEEEKITRKLTTILAGQAGIGVVPRGGSGETGARSPHVRVDA